jgi:probable rRNA maturation factor
MSPLRLDVDFSSSDRLPRAWDEARLRDLILAIVERELPPASYSLSVHFVSDQTIRALNAEHRSIDSATDVLSFPLHEPDFVLPPGEPVALGDVVISYPRAVAQADEFGHSVDRELAYLVAHGVLHILGYDHELEADQREMRAREEAALQPHGFTR